MPEIRKKGETPFNSFRNRNQGENIDFCTTKENDRLFSFLSMSERGNKIMKLLSESGSGKIRLAYLKVMFIRTDNKEALNV